CPAIETAQRRRMEYAGGARAHRSPGPAQAAECTPEVKEPAMTRPQSDTSLEQAVPDALRGYLDLPEVRTGFDRRARLIEVGQRIKDLRIAQGLTQAELAERVGTSQPEIVRLERGLGRQGPTIDTLMRVAGAMHK